MKKIHAWVPALMAILISLGGAAAEARDLVSVKSACLGDGWFSYQVRMDPNAFFSKQIMAFAGAEAFPNRIDGNLPPAGWTDNAETNAFFWNKDDQTETDGLPLEFTMRMRSSSSGFRTQTNFMVGFLLWFHGGLQSPLLSENVAGFARVPALVPCDPLESDGSPTELLSGFEFLPDPQVVELGADFLRYSWPSTNTVVIEASRDLQSWSNLAQTVGHGGTTTWFAAQAMDSYGGFFRVGLVAMHALTGDKASPAARSPASAAMFNRLTPKGLIASGPHGPTLIPASPTDVGYWHLPVSLSP